ncbi:MAG: hypothetical protein V4538_07055 [Bacteroidota bacterium]
MAFNEISRVKIPSINEQENQQLSSLRDWLLPMLINGQVTVGEAEEMVEEQYGMVTEDWALYKGRRPTK